MGRDDPNDPIDGPGWRDRLIDAPRSAWQGDDRILTRRHRAARAPWHGVLCDHLIRWEGRSVKELAGNIGWFYLRLTEHEVADLIRSAKIKRLIELESADTGEAQPLPEAERRWVVTEKGEKYSTPRGAAPRDLIKRIIPSVREVYGKTKLAVEAGALVLVGVFGYNLPSGSLYAELAFIAAVMVFVAVVLLGGLSDERALTAMAKAWPRLEDYRPAAYKFETTALRTPGPITALAASAVIAGYAACWRLAHHGKLSDPVWWQLVSLAAVVLVGLIYALHRRLINRAAKLRTDYDREHRELRQPEFR